MLGVGAGEANGARIGNLCSAGEAHNPMYNPWGEEGSILQE